MKPSTLRLDRLETRIAPAVATWDGGGGDNHWTTAANWVGDVAPNPGDDLLFPGGAAQFANVNDFAAGTAFHSIAISDVTFTPRYMLTGNAIALAAGLSVNVGVGASPSDVPVIGLPLTLTADQTSSHVLAGYNLTGPVDLNGHALAVSGVVALASISGPITGTGSLSFLGGPGTILSGASTFAGPTTVSQTTTLDVTGTLLGPVTVLTSVNGFGTLAGSGTVGDVTDSGVITAAGPGGGPHVRVFDGSTFAVVREFMAYDPAFTGGVFIAASRINGDLQADIITGAGAGGGPHVKVFDGTTGATLSSFFAYDAAFRGGVSIAGTDIQNSAGSVISGPGPGGGPDVRVFNGETGALTLEFLAYDAAFRGGVNVASRGPVFSFVRPPPPTAITVPPPTTITVGAIVTAPASNGGPDVRLFDATGQPIGEFLSYDPAFRGGVTVAVETNDGSGPVTVVTGARPGRGPHVKVWLATNNTAALQM
jgi:hypothetical protein